MWPFMECREEEEVVVVSGGSAWASMALLSGHVRSLPPSAPYDRRDKDMPTHTDPVWSLYLMKLIINLTALCVS